MPVGFRILPAQQTADATLIEALSKCATAHLADSMSHLQAASSALLPRHRAGSKLCGPALTVRVAPGDNLMIQKALDLARAGDVVVVDAGGYTEQAVVGEIMASYAITRQIAGFVVDGAIRDIDFISGITMPIYARGVTPRGPSKVGPGEINTPISIGGMVVQPGDIIVGDADGVVAIPASDLRTVLAAAQLLEAKELTTLAAVNSGNVDRSWIDAALASSGFDHAREVS